ncbi:apoptosis-associated speck-like protein containing a CARD [Talpa occidentalis]|uniref:apoptosis-associated speck-like protein containing a CARD n=1 Tax=Talpa occidentalis TaxID=50954 RepID=UPI00189096BE|nr:apoptosis-associated speck-like protein containing a CARD [Talpa occidentalis]
MGRARDAILEALENLTADELKKFKMKLLSVTPREGFGRIPRGQLLPLDAMDLTDKLVNYYREDYGAQLTGSVLREMGMQDLAEQLDASGSGPGAVPSAVAVPSAATALPQMAAKQGHFVDHHRAALIARVTNVEGILDALYGKVLTEEQYQAIRAEATNPTKMRMLFSFVPAWDLSCKNLLLQALRDTQPYLVTDLEK